MEEDTVELYHGCSEWDHKYMYMCSCYCEALAVSDDAWDDKPDANGILPGEIYLSIWSMGRRSKQLDWKDRLRWCWKILKTGFPFLDEICLKPIMAKKLGEDLIKRANKYGADKL